MPVLMTSNRLRVYNSKSRFKLAPYDQCLVALRDFELEKGCSPARILFTRNKEQSPRHARLCCGKTYKRTFQLNRTAKKSPLQLSKKVGDLFDWKAPGSWFCRQTVLDRSMRGPKSLTHTTDLRNLWHTQVGPAENSAGSQGSLHGI
jgi:hypothetical protein